MAPLHLPSATRKKESHVNIKHHDLDVLTVSQMKILGFSLVGANLR